MRKLVALLAPVALVTGLITGCTTKADPKEPVPSNLKPASKTTNTVAKPVKEEDKYRGFKVGSDGQVELPGKVLFKTGSDRLLDQSDPVLDHVLKYLKKNHEVTLLRVEGHTDTDGNEKTNLELSKKRAMSVSHWLTQKGIDCKRLMAVGFGERSLLIQNEKSPEDKAINRRVTFVNAHRDGVPIGALPSDGGGEIAGDPCE